MTDDRDHSDHHRLPFSYKATIAVSVLLIFVLGLVYFSLRNQRIATSFQVYGSKNATLGLNAVFRLVQFDNEGRERKNLPTRVGSVRLRQNGKDVSVQPQESKASSLPADVLVDTNDLTPGPAELIFEVSGWNGEERDVAVELTVVEPGPGNGRHFSLLPAISAPLESDKLSMELSTPGGGLLEGVTNTVWLRIADQDGRPVDAGPEYTLGAGETLHAPATGRLGITPLHLIPQGLNQNLVIDVPFRGETCTWQEMVAPNGLIQLSVDSYLLPPGRPAQVKLRARTYNETQELYCTLWRNSSAIDFLRLTTADHAGTIELELPAQGFYWATCNDHFVSSDAFHAVAPLVVSAQPGRILAMLLALFPDDPFFSAWPPPDRMTPDERVTAISYLFSRMTPDGPEFAQLTNTYASDAQDLREQAGTQRDVVLVLIGLVGMGLLLWAVAVAIKQHTRMTRTFKEFQGLEDVGDALAREGITRRKSYLPALLVVLTIVANLFAILWLLRLVFF